MIAIVTGRVQGELVQPYYAANLSGGGWPEGQNYGPLATFNMTFPVIAALTGKGLDLVHATAPYAFPSGAALWYVYNTWPSLTTVDDRGQIYGIPNPSPAPVQVMTELAGMLPSWKDPHGRQFQSFVAAVRAADQPGTAPPNALWSDFLFWNPKAPSSPYQALPLSYLARGMEMGSVRSDWTARAVWGSFDAGPYTDYPGSGEEFFDAGSLAIVHGGRPFLVSATGELYRNATSDPGNFIYNDNYSDQAAGGCTTSSAPALRRPPARELTAGQTGRAPG